MGSYGVTFDTVGTGRQITASGSVSVSPDSQTGITVTPAGATHFGVTGYPSPATAGDAHNVTVTALDAYGNVATGYLGTVHVTSTDGAAVLPANHAFTGGDGGIHQFSVTLKTAGSQSITATDTVTGSINGTQAGITVTPAAATHLTVSGYPSPTTAGVAHNVTVTALDAFGNVATGYLGTVHVTSTDGAAVLPATTRSRAATTGSTCSA